VALAMSTWLEGYGWSVPAAFGVALILLGNVLVLARPRAATAPLRAAPVHASNAPTTMIQP
jgi:hypothetical protein